MFDTPDSIQDVIGEGGTLSRFLKDFEFRSSQIQMARLIERSLLKKIPVIIEAGTGTGKTLGYLVPLVMNNKKIVISTGTKNLQEQIFNKDIPLLLEATGLDADAVLMKGRKNYLCLHRYHQRLSYPSMFESEENIIRKRIDQWLKRTEFADRAELPWLADDEPLWDAISATSDQCLGSDCLHFKDCFLNTLRRRAARADIIIVNHYLFFADLMVKEGGFGEIIPRFQTLVFDEAHHLEDIATAYIGESLGTGQLMDLVRDIEKVIEKQKVSGKTELSSNLNLIRTGVTHLLSLFSEVNERGRLDDDLLLTVDQGPGLDIKSGLDYILNKCVLYERESSSMKSCSSRAEKLLSSLSRVFSLKTPDWLGWYERRRKGITFHASPLDISKKMQELLYDKTNSIVFTSATLSTNGRFDYIRSRLGLLEETLEGIYPSHFNFRSQALMYVPMDMPDPRASDFASKMAERIMDILKISSGRALILFTSYNNLNFVYGQLKDKIPYTIFRQGEAPRSVLLEEFKKDTHSVLLATGSFWQGVDVPGEALSCLIIDKLPFDSPGDPLVAARIELIRNRKGNPFMEYQIPSAIISLKQGLGRLIRNTADRGIFAIMDSRIINSRYGRAFIDSLPEIPLCHGLDKIGDFFRQTD